MVSFTERNPLEVFRTKTVDITNAEQASYEYTVPLTFCHA